MNKYIFFDTETTGLETQDRIVQIAGVILDDHIEKFDEKCNPGIPISFEAMATHHITNEMIKDKSPFQETMFFSKLKEYNNKNNFLIAHNITFDIEMLKKEIDFELEYTLIDTLKLSKHLYKESKKHNLQYLRYYLELYKKEKEALEHLKISTKLQAHDAFSDVVFLRLLFGEIFEEVKKQFNLNNKKDILNKIIKLTEEPILISIFNFGKYKDKTIKEVIFLDMNYINWLLKNENTDKDLIYSINYFLKEQ